MVVLAKGMKEGGLEESSKDFKQLSENATSIPTLEICVCLSCYCSSLVAKLDLLLLEVMPHE